MGYNPWNHKELDTTEQLSTHTDTHNIYTHTYLHVLVQWNLSNFSPGTGTWWLLASLASSLIPFLSANVVQTPAEWILPSLVYCMWTSSACKQWALILDCTSVTRWDSRWDPGELERSVWITSLFLGHDGIKEMSNANKLRTQFRLTALAREAAFGQINQNNSWSSDLIAVFWLNQKDFLPVLLQQQSHASLTARK